MTDGIMTNLRKLEELCGNQFLDMETERSSPRCMCARNRWFRPLKDRTMNSAGYEFRFGSKMYSELEPLQDVPDVGQPFVEGSPGTTPRSAEHVLRLAWY